MGYVLLGENFSLSLITKNKKHLKSTPTSALSTACFIGSTFKQRHFVNLETTDVPLLEEEKAWRGKEQKETRHGKTELNLLTPFSRLLEIRLYRPGVIWCYTHVDKNGAFSGRQMLCRCKSTRVPVAGHHNQTHFKLWFYPSSWDQHDTFRAPHAP